MGRRWWRWCFPLAASAMMACQHPRAVDDSCARSCGDGQACRYDACVPVPAACDDNAGCSGDQYCDPASRECLPWGVGPGGTYDARCAGEPAPGAFFPVLQCAWSGPPGGDAFPDHRNVLATPMVAVLDAAAGPSIVFASYNFSDDNQSLESCAGSDPRYFGVIRVIDGRTCEQRATISAPSVIAAAPVAIGDLGGDDTTPEIVAARSPSGVVAFTHRSSGWQVLWQAESTPGAQCHWAGPAIHDLDDDGAPEVIFEGAVYDGRTGAAIDESLTRPTPEVDATGVGYVPVVADLDGDGAPELVTGKRLYRWDRAARRWSAGPAIAAPNGLVAVGDLGTFPAIGQDDRAHVDGIAETVVVHEGVVRVFNTAGREVFAASFQGGGGPTVSQGGPPIIADFDGDGRGEIGSAGTASYHVFDLDCLGMPRAQTCASLATDGVLWRSAVQNGVTDLAGSSAFDFDGDGRAEVVSADPCFTRVHDGATGRVLASRHRRSCLRYENPVVVDSDGDLRAELITTSNIALVAAARSCRVSCPLIDPLFDGPSCVDDSDCAGQTRCAADPGQPGGDPARRDRSAGGPGRCRCTADGDCGDGYACRDPEAGPSPAGKVCRAVSPPVATPGVQVLADAADRWLGALPIWNQHAFSVTNIDPSGRVPRTSEWQRNWTVPGLNNFRANIFGNAAAPYTEPDLTVRHAQVTCGEASGPVVIAEICNRGNHAVPAHVPVAVYAATTPSRLRCATQTDDTLAPGQCASVSCSWRGAGGDGAIVVDDRGTGSGTVRECREDNNVLTVRVACP